MKFAAQFRRKLKSGQICLGTSTTFTDPTVVDCLCHGIDFIWIEMEHGTFSLETVQNQILAAHGKNTPTLVRVAWNDPVLLKPVLDMGTDGVIIPMIRTAEDVRQAVAACRYPPKGIRGFGPRVAMDYGRVSIDEYFRQVEEDLLIVPQIEHIDAVNNIDEIVKVEGVAGFLLGPNDLSFSMGLPAQTEHPEVVAAAQHAIDKVRAAGLPMSVGTSPRPDSVMKWIERGVQFPVLGGDFILLMQAMDDTVTELRRRLGARAS